MLKIGLFHVHALNKKTCSFLPGAENMITFPILFSGILMYFYFTSFLLKNELQRTQINIPIAYCKHFKQNKMRYGQYFSGSYSAFFTNSFLSKWDVLICANIMKYPWKYYKGPISRFWQIGLLQKSSKRRKSNRRHLNISTYLLYISSEKIHSAASFEYLKR